MKYNTVRADFEALERIAELDDQMELDARRLEIMQNPTKKKAVELYSSAIDLWFAEHGVSVSTRAIAERNGIR